MRVIRRWTTSIMSSFEAMINQIENHDALVQSALQEVQDAGARAKVQFAKVQFAKVQQDGLRMRKRLMLLRDEAELWRDRAVRAAENDERKALECVRRMKLAEHAIIQLEEDERVHAKLERQLSDDLAQLDERLIRLKDQRNALRSRQSRAEALRAVKAEDSHMISELDQIFERWQEKVVGYELQADLSDAHDTLADEFTKAELENELKQSLEALVSSHKEGANH